MRRLLLVFGVLVLASPVPAEAASVRIQIYKDCEDGSLDGTYSQADIRDARQNMPSDVAEYTDCVDVLRRAELTGTSNPPPTPEPITDGGGSSGAGGGPPAAPEPAAAPPPLVPETDGDRAALEGAARAGDQPVTVGGENLLAGVTPLGDSGNPLPAPLVVALIGLGLAGLAIAVPSLRRHATTLLRRP
ncbi:MAG: hypothetical protein WKF94_02730 [Solirubrobacteraceae bacterium]